MQKFYASWPLAVLLLLCGALQAQSVGIGTTTPNASAQLDINSSSRGLLIPRMDSAAIVAIANPAKGLLVYDSSRNQLLVNMGTAASPNWQNIVANSGWSLNGNSGTNGSAFVGTTDATPLVFKAENFTAGTLDLAGNVSLGLGALASGPVFSGGTSGSNNVAIGNFALAANTTSSSNTAVGSGAASSNSTGRYLTAIGEYALENNTTGFNNIAVGTQALISNHTGSGNTAVGSFALTGTTNSSYNTVVGYNSGVSFDNGYNNVFVGANCDVNGAGYYNVVAIGQDVICTGSSQARIGNAATGSIGGYADWTNFSDGRYKKNMRENVKGLDFIMRLRPITYNLDVTGIRTHLGQTDPKDAATRQSIQTRENTLFSGFSAQEVEQAAAAAGYDFSGVDKPKNANDFYGLRYGDFVVPLVKAVQEQQAMIVALQQEVAELKKQLHP